jgi:RNA polymerase sigma-70 factor (ECF subfamily)
MDDPGQWIAEGLQRGSREAWSRLYETYAERVWRQVAGLMGGDAADVADVVQEVFLAAAKSARRFDPARGSLWMWLLGIARHQVALRLRQQRARLEKARRWWVAQDGPVREWLAGHQEAPPDVLESKELAWLVRAALLKLPADYQALLARRYLDEATAGQIAQATGSTSEAVRAKLMRARGAFREAFSRLAGHEPEHSGS